MITQKMVSNLQLCKNKILLAVLTLEFLGCFLVQSVNEVAARFTSLVSFFVLGLLVLAKITKKPDLRSVIADREFIVMAAGSVIALVNLFLIGSNKGAFLTAADVLMAMYAADDVRLGRGEKIYFGALGSAFLMWWYCTVRWYYNFNMVGMIFMITCILTLLLLEQLKDSMNRDMLGFIQIIAYITATLLCLLYHARCVLAGMLIMGILFLTIHVLLESKVLKLLLTLAATVGSIFFTLMYIAMDRLGLNIVILYKDILSGRQDIWGELWGALMRQPLTGIGSSYQIKSFFIFEVHNGMLDILVVHGLLVFAALLFLMIRRLGGLAAKGIGGRIAASGLFAILFTSFFENFFINSPYLLVTVVLIGWCSGDDIIEKH